MSSRLVVYGIAAAIFLLDRLTKAIIQAQVAKEDIYVVIPGLFNIVRVENRGAAFGLFRDIDNEWRAFFLVGISMLVLALVAAVLWRPSAGGVAGDRASRLALSLVLGGALGNLYDRLVNGAVTDFLDFYLAEFHWPAFNVADSAITVGAGLLLLDLWLSRRKAVS
jgi:signal peptidase II